MKIKMLTLQAGPAGVRKPGVTYNVSDEEAKALIAGGYAEAVKKPQAEAESPVIEKAERASKSGATKAAKDS